jgi:hypothetical protein
MLIELCIGVIIEGSTKVSIAATNFIKRLKMMNRWHWRCLPTKVHEALALIDFGKTFHS